MEAGAQRLDGIGLFADLPEEDLRRIEQRCLWQRFAEGELVFDRHSRTLDVYFVVEGSLRAFIEAGERDIAFADIAAGGHFGELSAIDGRPRSLRVMATSDTLVAALDRAAFLELARKEASISFRLMEHLARLVRDLDDRVAELATRSAAGRVVGMLLRLAKAEPDGGWAIPVLPNHKEIAAWAGAPRETVAQVIGELARDGLVKRRGVSLIIDRPALQTYTENPALPP